MCKLPMKTYNGLLTNPKSRMTTALYIVGNHTLEDLSDFTGCRRSYFRGSIPIVLTQLINVTTARMDKKFWPSRVTERLECVHYN